MASNDMNSWGDDPDERLRQDWQQAFAGFKVQSRPALREHILRRAVVHNRPKPTGWRVGGVLLVLISSVLVYTIHRDNRPVPVQGRIANVQPISPSHSGRVTARQSKTWERLPRPLDQSSIGSRVNGLGDRQLPTGRQPMVSSAETAVVNGSSTHSRLQRNWLRLRAESNRPLTDSYRADRPFAKLPRFADTRSPVTSAPSLNASYRERVIPQGKNTGDGTGEPTAETQRSAIPPVTQAVEITRLSSQALSRLASSLRALPDQLPADESVHTPTGAAENRVRRGNQWFIETVPLSSFQWMSTSPTSTVHLTQVNAPPAFSPATWGYQINGGLRWQHWQAYVSVGQLRRWAYYTVNENRFRLESDPANSFQQVQEKHVVAENVALPMIGGGLNHYRFLGQGRYRVELGSQVVYSLMDGQRLASLRGGAGRRLLLSRQLELQTGLLLEYGLTRLMSQQQQLTIHPLVVGVSIRLQPRLYSSER